MHKDSNSGKNSAQHGHQRDEDAPQADAQHKYDLHHPVDGPFADDGNDGQQNGQADNDKTADPQEFVGIDDQGLKNNDQRGQRQENDHREDVVGDALKRFAERFEAQRQHIVVAAGEQGQEKHAVIEVAKQFGIPPQVVIADQQPEKGVMQHGRGQQQPGIAVNGLFVVEAAVA